METKCADVVLVMFKCVLTLFEFKHCNSLQASTVSAGLTSQYYF